jgi:hypothetical protein
VQAVTKSLKGGKLVAAIALIVTLIIALIGLWHCLRRAPNTNTTMPVREVRVPLVGFLRPDPKLLGAITTVEIGHAAWVRVGADSDCPKQQSKPEMIVVSAEAANGADSSTQPAIFDVQLGAESAWHLDLAIDNPGQIRLTASAPKPTRAMLRPPGRASVLGCNGAAAVRLPDGTQITAEGAQLELVVHLSAGDKNAAPLPILGKVPLRAVSGKLAKGRKNDANITRTTHCDWDTTNPAYETFGVVAAGTAAANLTVDKLELHEGIADLQFTWDKVTWQPGGDCSCRCLKELAEVFDKAKP